MNIFWYIDSFFYTYGCNMKIKYYNFDKHHLFMIFFSKSFIVDDFKYSMILFKY